MYERMDACMYVCTYVCNVCMYVCMYVCMSEFSGATSPLETGNRIRFGCGAMRCGAMRCGAMRCDAKMIVRVRRNVLLTTKQP